MVDVFLPAGTHIRETEAFAGDVQQLHPGAARRHPRHVVHRRRRPALPARLLARKGRTAPSCSSWSMSMTRRKIDGLMADIQKHLDEQLPECQRHRQEVPPGPGRRAGASRRGSAAPIPRQLRELGDQAMKVLEDDGGAVCVRSDWRERVKVIRPDLLELQARRNGITRVEVAQALESSFEGRVVGFYREPGDAGAGVFPQETRLLPIVARPPLAEREDVARDQQPADLEPGRRADDPPEPGHVRRRGRLGRPGRDAPRSLPDPHRPCRPAVRPAQPVVRPRAVEDRADRAAAGLFARMGRRVRGLRPTPAPPWPSRSPTCWRSWCSSSCVCSIRSAPRC